MAMFYTGYRPIFQGQSDSDWVNTYTGKVGVYSNWSLMSRKHLLDGAPKVNHVPGTGYSPHDVFLSRRFLGLDTKEPMDGAGLGPRFYEGSGRDTSYGPGLDSSYGKRDDPVFFGYLGRFAPWQYKGLAVAKATPAGYGHVAFRNLYYAYFVNWFFHGLPADEVMKNPGHRIRPIAIGLSQDISSTSGSPPATFGYFDPWKFKGVVSAQECVNPGQVSTSGIYYNAYLDRDHLGGHNKVNEWIGVTSSKALGTGTGRVHHGNH